MGIKSDVEDLVEEFGAAGLMAYNVDAIDSYLGEHPHRLSWRIQHLKLLVGYVEKLEQESNQRITIMDAHVTNFDFGAALTHLKAGRAVMRGGWNGKGQFVCMMPALQLPPFNTQGTERKVNDRTAKWIGVDTPLDCQPYFALFNAQKKWQPGWVPSTGDLLANDWCVHELDA